MEHITTILQKTLAKHGVKNASTAAEIITKLHQYIQKDAPDLYASVEDITCRNNEITIHCSHSIAVQELQQLKPSLEQYLRNMGDKPWGVRVVRAK
jgi:hypothetical protein